MRKFAIVFFTILLPLMSRQDDHGEKPKEMTRMVVRLMGPAIRPGSFAALPKTIYRASDEYARIEDPPDARQHVQKLTVIARHDAWSANLTDKRGTHSVEHGGAGDLPIPIVLPLDPRHKLGKLDGIEFGAEYEFFEQAGAAKKHGPVINAKPTDAYELQTPEGPATLVVRAGTHRPVTLSWRTADGVFTYEYIEYADRPFDARLFAKPVGIEFRELPADGRMEPN